MPMISRILKLLVLDILTVGVAMRRQGQADAASGDGSDAEAAPTLAHMSHQAR